MKQRMQERHRMLKEAQCEDIKKYTWTEGNKENTRNEINRWNPKTVQYFNIRVSKFRHQVPSTKDYVLYSSISQLPLSAAFWIVERSSDKQNFTIAVNESEAETIINDLMQLNIPFSTGVKVEITEDNIEGTIWEILNSKSISTSFRATQIIQEKKKLLIAAELIYVTEDKYEDRIMKRLFYQKYKELDVLIYKTLQREHSFSTFIIGTQGVIEELRSTLPDAMKLTIIEGLFIHEEQNKQQMNTWREEKKHIIEELEAQAFDALTKEEKIDIINSCMETLKANIATNRKEEIRNNVAALQKHIGLQLYERRENATWGLKYIKEGEQMFLNEEKLSFIDNDEGTTNEDVSTIKCPFCNTLCNDTTWIQNHISFDHGIRLRNDISFTLQYAIMRKDDIQHTPETQTCYKCPHCEYINNVAEHVLKHCAITHKKKKTKLKEGMIGNKEDIKSIAVAREQEKIRQQQEEAKRNTSFNPRRIQPMDPTTYFLMRCRTCVETQTEQPQMTDTSTDACNQPILKSIESQTGEMRGGARNTIATTNNNLDRAPATRKEDEKMFNIPILRIRRNLKSNLVGLHNGGAACYMNSLIQALHNITPFRKAISKHGAMGNTIASTLNLIFSALDTKQDIKDAWYVNLEDTNIYRLLHFEASIQSDPSEVFLALIDLLERVNPEFGELFEHYEIKHMITTGNEEITPSTLLKICLPEETDNIYEEHKIEDLLSSELSSDIIDEYNVKVGESQLTISSDILCMQIMRTTKRFSKDMYRLHLRKTIAIQNTIYELRAIIVHHGPHTEAGHYTTYIIDGAKTYHINDIKACTSDIRLNKKYVTTDNITDDGRAAMAFYQKIEDPSAEIIRENIPSMEQEIANAYQVSILSQTEQEQSNITEDNDVVIQTPVEEEQIQQVEGETQLQQEQSMNGSIEMYTTLKDPVPMKFPNEEEKRWIRQVNEQVNRKLNEATNPEEFMQKITELKTETDAWNRIPNLHGISIDNDINIITIAIIKGTLPIAKEEKICGYPNCPQILKSGMDKTTHWKKVHNLRKSSLYNPLEELFEIQGKDIATIVSDEKDLGYIKCPLFKCPKDGCEFTVHKAHNLIEHIRSAHNADHKAVIKLSQTYKILWILHASKKPLTLMNLLYRGEVIQCKKCGYCTTHKVAAENHTNLLHREEKKQNIDIKRNMFINYTLYERDGMSLSPFIGSTNNEDNTYTLTSLGPRDTSTRTKEELIRISTQPIQIHTEAPIAQTQTNTTTQQEITQVVQNTPQQAQETPTSNDSTIATQEGIDEQDSVAINTANDVEEEDKEDNNDKEYLPEEAIDKCLEWHNEYHDMRESLPKYRSDRRKVLTEAMKCAIKDEALPLLYVMCERKLPNNAPKEEIVNGALCKCFHSIVEKAKHALGIISKKGNGSSGKKSYEEELHRKRASRNAGYIISTNIQKIESIRNEYLDEGLRQNRIDPIINDIVALAEELTEDMQKAIFDTNDITKERVINTVEDIIAQGNQTNILTYIESADKDIENMEETHKRKMKKKIQELFRISPSRAMRYYVDPHVSPNCPIPLEKIRDELATRWQAPQLDAEQAVDKWPIQFKLNDEDRKYIMEEMQNPDLFKRVIMSRDITSAHGTDGIGYWALKLVPELGGELMATISKLIIKYKFMPTTWNTARTILLYKKGDENDLKNWRPLTIASCIYRTWTCALATCIQDINRSGSKLFDDNQKGFIKHKNGCLEHSNMITEAICDANRNNKDIYIASLDLRDAFGSVPHEYIKFVLNEMEFPEEIKALIGDSYDKGTARVRIGSQESDIIHIHKGVKQGCPLSPLIFNFCMNPLLSKVEEIGEGYKIKDGCFLKIQAYADDIIIFASTREGLQTNLNIVDEFLRYAKVTVNTNKCHTMSYVYRDRKRYYEEEPFQIAGEDIPVSNLAESIEYLGTDATTTNRIRKHGVLAGIERMKDLVKQIANSMLTLNQKIYAIKTFAIPQLDYILTNKRIDLKVADEIDRLIRRVINLHVRGAKLPISLFYTHWKDGGLSITKLKERAICLRAKTFMELYNTRSEKVRTAMRVFTESERMYRKIGKLVDEDEEETFLNWKIEDGAMHKGTDTITIHALRSVKKLGIRFTLDEDTDNIIAIAKQIRSNEPHIPEEVVGEPTESFVKILSSRELLQHIMKYIRKQYNDDLLANKGIGHSFIDIQNSPYANKFIGDYTHPINDNIASWIIKARCNRLFTGALACKTNVPKDRAPRCPYCSTLGGDTIAHRINNCKQSRTEQTKRHNNIQNIIMQYMKKRCGQNMNYRTNSTLNIENKHVKESLRMLKPDIIAWDKEKILIVEFSCPYANVGEHGNKLNNVYREKHDKYKALADECERVYKRKTSTYTIIVSSLGAVQKQSIDDIRKLLKIDAHENRLMNTILRRLSLTACIGSYFIYNKLKYCQYIVDTNDNTNEGETQDEVSTPNDQHAITMTENGPNDREDAIEEEGNIGPEGAGEDEDDSEEEEDPVADAGQQEDNEGTQLQSAGIAGDSPEEGEGISTPANTNNASDSQESLSTG